MQDIQGLTIQEINNQIEIKKSLLRKIIDQLSALQPITNHNTIRQEEELEQQYEVLHKELEQVRKDLRLLRQIDAQGVPKYPSV